MNLIPGRSQVLSMRNLYLCLGMEAMVELISTLRETTEPTGLDTEPNPTDRPGASRTR